ncbi:lipoprotein [Eggerthella sp. CAG:1427]|nr:lipoprotein [Eggerthella sp. CAG:1427]
MVEVAGVHFEPMGIFSSSVESLDDVAEGAVVAVPNDATNEARALLLLEQEGLIEVDDEAGINATINDITSNPKNLEFEELEAANLPNVLEDVSIAVINGNYALAADFTMDDALAVEANDSLAADTYTNVIVVKDGNQDSEKIKALAEACNSDEVRDYITDNYQGSVVAVF